VLRTPAAVEIEDAPLGTLPAYSSDESLQPGQPTTGRTLSLADLLHGATNFIHSANDALVPQRILRYLAENTRKPWYLNPLAA
jgi:hypothetical protein